MLLCFGAGGRPDQRERPPAVGGCLWSDDAGAYLAWSITVLTPRGDRIADLTSFLGREHLEPFGLPGWLP